MVAVQLRQPSATGHRPLLDVPTRVGYVVSMATGVHSFVFREIEQLERRNFSIKILAISRGHGPYMPRPGWPVVFPSPAGLFIGLVTSLLRNFRRTVLAAVEALRNRALVDLGIALSFLPFLQLHPVDSFHSHFGDHKMFVAYYLRKLSALPISVTIHAYELYSNPNPVMFRKGLSACAAVITVSEYNRRILEDNYQIPTERIKAIHLFSERAMDPTFAKVETPFNILCVARFVPKKGHDVLLRALRTMVDAGETDVRLVLVGHGPVDVQGLIASMALQEYVTIHANVSDDELSLLYRSANAFCLPSRTDSTGDREGIPVVLMEAMACGVPVVTTPNAGIPELVTETLVSENDAAGLADALLRLKHHPELAKEQIQSNLETILARFSPSNVDELARILRRVQHEIL